ncbi:flagellar biosynthesis protein FlgM [Aquibium carbonis]|uniref:Flagellar biosynthesis protein FlgM n=1 Tax=Aquibium carbonis TaxID=2495581 RepID=A0A3R9ZUH2_9HYPH|nr:neutral zinc metallopeptidase [Aquibium carbonis]RST82132.1 flagellar biosynthesis protein FlgM [Aquibium carbonis]
MRWKDRRQSSNVDDRRGQGGGAGRGGFGRGGGMRIPIGRTVGGGGVSGIIILVVVFFALRACGIDPLEILAQMESEPASGGTRVTTTQASDETARFAGVVLAETEDVWNGIFQAQGATYREPTMVLYSGQVRSACGFASAASGPFYCPGDSKVYLDLDFFGELDRRFGASGDFAQAYVIAHEVGHHVQNLIGVLPEFNRRRQTMSQVEANRMSVRVELQADCFAGIWAHFTEQKGLLEAGDIDEALNAANQIGDDTLQKRTQGYVVPDSFNHGTSAQRREWFSRGLDSGRLDDCDTFNADL